MHRQEMLELAALEAYGLLDQYESALFNRSFHNAPATVQQEVVKLQEQLAADTATLPSDEPPDTLRERVLAAVNQAIEQESPGPIASIGRRTAAELAESSDQQRTVVESRLTRSGQFWRAASFFLVASLIVMAYFLGTIMQQNFELTKRALENNTGAQIEQLIGPTFKDFLFDATTEWLVFDSTNDDAPHYATLAISEVQAKAFLLTERMPDLEKNQHLTLQVRDANGRLHTLVRFESKDALSGMHVSLDGVAMGEGMSWEIASPDGVLMRA